MLNETTLLPGALWLFFCASFLSMAISLISKRASITASGILGIIASLLGIAGSLCALSGQSTIILTLPFIHIPFIPSDLVIDPLTAFFILVTCLTSLPVSLYSIGYLKAEYMEKPVGLLGALYHLFILSMLLVTMAANSLQFLIFWESMALFSFALVIFDARSETARKAGFLYLLMTHVGTAFILMFFLLMSSHTGSFEFSAYHLASHTIPMALKFPLFLMLLIGFGTKAGIVPLHIWLPEAHPAAPSHISALMSGIMIKTAVYGLLRCTFDFLAPFPHWWGMILAGIAIITALLGIIYASVENDLKRLLAYSSIENMGIILLSLGAGMIFHSLGYSFLAIASVTAGLLHLLNHAIFKGLLFLGAGSVGCATHSRSLENLGGLIRKMPQTSLFFLIGILAICAFPPLNGFTSEWLIFQNLLSSFQLTSDFVRIFLLLCAVLLGLVGAMAVATFVKTFSTGFLALPRSPQAKQAREVSPSMVGGMGMLAVLCLGLGVGPTFIIPILTGVSHSLLGTQTTVSLASPDTLSIPFNPEHGMALSPILLLAVSIVLSPLALILPRLLGSRTGMRREETWACGVTLAPEFEYTPSGFSQPLEVVYAKLHKTVDAYYRYLYAPCVEGLIRLANQFRVIQLGSLQIYLVYILVTLITCLAWIQR